MNGASQSCQSWREDLSLLASGLLPEPEQERVAGHLAACAACREYYAEIQRVAVSLAGAREDFTALQPSPEAQARWAAAVHAAGSPELVCSTTFIDKFREWYLDVIWPYRRVWTGLATVWLLIFAGHISLGEHSEITVAKSSPQMQQQMAMAFKDRQMVLAELLADHFVPHDADRQKFFLPKPRSEYMNVFAA